MFLSAFTLAALVALARVAWFLYRRSVVKSPLRTLPGPPSKSWRTGHLGLLYNPYGMKWHHELNQKYGGVAKINGIWGDEQLYIADPKALHHVCVKEVDNFEETDIFVLGNQQIFGDGLLSTWGAKHKQQRRILNPIFSTSHMRDVTPVLYHVIHLLKDRIAESTASGPAKVDMLDYMMRTALEGIGQAGLGHSYEALSKGDGNSPFRLALRGLIPAIFSLQIERQMLLPAILSITSPSIRRQLVDMTPSRRLHKLRDIVDCMYKTNKQVLEEKKQALREGEEKVSKQVGQGRDIVSVLLRALENSSEEDGMSDSEVLAHMTTLVFTSHDTTSSTLAHILHFLAIHPDVQEKLRQEIKTAKDQWEKEHSTRDIAYDELNELPFLENVIRETLRLEAPVTFMSRTARADSVMPLSRPIRGTDGQLITEVPVAKNQNVIIGIAAADRDPEIWGDDAAEWKPERWTDGVPKRAAEAHLPGIYAGTMAFLGGGRACIGYKFAQLEIKLIISVLIDHFRFSLSDEEITWHLANIQMPYVESRVSDGPTLPLTVARL
ncbi:cytochrome P450 [Gloeophyllum trabeum ATCC 11539]|uniref:Cytochrome P450 n=1 Tax=Gloeophyllum trabeum (strain ATCC 11539 / FP-39264 / Madison 617) TaxID=670483 RepID=S7PZ96_GLOTA|nr:cytochrome P450 [Gloeophyllum trabeum ATCC 11539]EPQ52971.1 cytochrome P450 [Gloeophyllum trabeum ATCC 11539]